MKLEIFYSDFRGRLKYQISSNSVQWKKSCSMLTDRMTDMTKLTFASRNFANAPKNWKALLVLLLHTLIRSNFFVYFVKCL